MNTKRHDSGIYDDAPESKDSDFVFAGVGGGKFGVILSRRYVEILERFHAARMNAGTWGEFKDMLGSKVCAYILPFTACDNPTPADDDPLDGEVCQEVYLFSDDEFPFMQCAEETYTNHGWLFPEIPEAVEFRTEYGQPLKLYPEAQFGTLKTHLDRQGFSIDPWD